MNTTTIHPRSPRLLRETLRLTFCLAACLAVASVSAQTLLFDFPFNEGTGTNVNSTTNALVGTLGVGLVDVGCDPFELPAYQTNSDPSFSSDTPSGLAGDYSLAFDDIGVDLGCGPQYAGERVRVDDAGGVVDVADPAGTNFTFQCWVKLAAQPESRTTIFDCNAPGLRVNLGINGNRTLLFTATGIDDVTSTAEIVDDGGWHHIAMVHQDGVEVRFYIDGILRDAVTYTNGVQTGGSQAYFNIGGEVWDWPFLGSMVHPFIGNLDRISLTKGIVMANDLDWRSVPGVDPLAPSLGVGITTITSLPPVISVNMTDGGSNGAQAGNTAGAVLAGYWEEIAPSGTALGTTDLNNLVDHSGAASGVGLIQSAAVGGWWNSDAYPSGFSGSYGNDMYGNFADTDFAYTYTFSNVNAGVGTLYDVYIYSARGFTNTGVTQFDVNGETKFLANESTVGDYTESGWSSQALAEANPDSGNYVRFQNVSLDALVVGINGLEDLTSGGISGSVSGLQIVSVGPGAPAEVIDISWPTLPAGYKLQSTTNISDTNSWVDVANSPSAVGTGAYHYYGTKSSPQMFYRLLKE